MNTDELEKVMREANRERSEENLTAATEAYVKYAYEGGSVFVETRKGRLVTTELDHIPGINVVSAYKSSSYIRGPLVTSAILLEDLMALIASVDSVNGILFNRGTDSFSYLDERICEFYLKRIEEVKTPIDIASRLLERYEFLGNDDEV